MTRMTTIFATLTMLALPGILQAQDPHLVARGAGVWANNCVRCHNARPSTERTDAQWVVIVSHMRARANLTREEATMVAAYLQATNLPEGVAPTANVQPPEAVPAEEPATGSEASSEADPGASSGGRPGGTSAAGNGDAAGGEAGAAGKELRLDPDVLARLLAYVTVLRKR